MTVPIRDAATVVLLRDGSSGLEAWLLTRVTEMEFAAGMSVFPGGRVDDADGSVPLAGAELTELGARFDCPPETAHALLAAAARETFEETGVLLTTPAADLADSRADVEEGRLAFGDLLRTHDLAVDAAALRPWSRWVTPEGEVRRYDTRFFVAALPDGAVARDVTTESSEADWLPIDLALQQAERRLRALLPPTMITLASVRAHGTVEAVLAAAADQVLEPTRPELIDDDGRPAVRLPNGSIVPIPRDG